MASTPYAETECLLAVMEDNTAKAEQVAGAMTAREQRDFIDHLHQTIAVVNAAEPEVL